ncbi:AAA family ATPase [Streptomyces avicenniae]|uniref:AAA family ATPase n=1 Tax=Streptomyces avicenniae TaxID=500153 RepID=UPI00069ACD36|nr:AAA family ATPase [Streptomyces avicenniae]
MRLHRLTLTAFGPFGGTQHVDFDALAAAGLFLLHGPTGAGKTSVLDAVCFALYGTVPGARQSSGVSLRSDHAEPGTATEVVLELTLGDRRLEITRRPEQVRPKRRGTGTTRDRARTLLRERDAATAAWRPLSASHQEIADELGGLLGGMSREQFCQVVLLPQGEFARFLRAGAEERAKLLGRLFDTRRFADAEAHLATLRAEAADRVREADEHLRATAHRIEQAAASLPGVPEAPGTEGALGDPADAVLTWAAHARSTAREHQDITRVALHTAEAAHAAAGEEHTETRERARLRTRFADAHRRADALAAAQPERDRVRHTLDLARAADSVAPALALRDASDADHEAAAEAERRARAHLPPDLADAPALQLTDRERAVREQLGALAAAAHAESRAQRITADLAELDAETAAERNLVAEESPLLAAWPGTAERLRARLDLARAAASRAEALAQRLEPAERRLAAADRRDDLAEAVHAARERLLHARETAADAYAHWLDLRERRLRGIAAELAAGLTPGEPCAVCGSPDHPHPTPAAADHVDRADEEAASAAHRSADEGRARAEARLATLREQRASAAAEAGDEPRTALAAAVTGLRADLDAARAQAADESAARQALTTAERDHDTLRDRIQETERRTAARVSRRTALDAERASLLDGIERARAGAPTVAARTTELAALADALGAAADAARATAETADRLKTADDRVATAAFGAGFPTPRAAGEASLDRAEQRALQERLDSWYAEETSVAALLTEERAAGPAVHLPADPAATEAALVAATARLRTAAAAEAASRARGDALDQLAARAAVDRERLAPLRAEASRVTRLAGLTAGTSQENEYRMRLETYVLAARLEQVAAAAGTRLHRMSSGRYTLVHSDARAPHRQRSGLGLHIMDAWTGRARDTASLSGGESFFVSLALALGLADVVTAEAGGIRLDTLFIDEGFGSLDEQSLDEVLDVLDGLREHDRSVAIVSHVPDLRSRVPAQLEVVKSRTGSTLRHHMAPATA